MNLSQLFQLSYLSADAGIYFNRVLFVSSLAQHPDPKVAAIREEYFGFLRTQGRYYVGNIQKANGAYLELGLPALELPKYPNDFFDWISAFRKNLLTKVEEQSLERWTIDYGYYMASISGDIGLLQWALRLKAEAPNAPDQTKQIESLISSAQRSKQIMAGLSMLLGSNEPLRILWQEWKSLEALLDQLLAYDLPNDPEKFQEAISFSEALLAKYRERAEAISKAL
jgi:hypothetical protein